MKRRNFLSLISCAALAAVVPKRSYFFLNGLWRPDAGAITLEIVTEAFRKTWEASASLTIPCEEVWVKERGATKGYWRFGLGPWFEIPNFHWHGESPYVQVDFNDEVKRCSDEVSDAKLA